MIVNLLVGLHDLDNGGLNGISSIILHLALHLGGLCLLGRLGAHHGNLVSVKIALVLWVHEQLVIRIQ